MDRFQFPAWVNTLIPVLGGVVVIGAMYAGGVFALAVHPLTTDVGYTPEQPVPFSHAIHAGKLKMDCRYCHNTVEVAGHAAIPPVSTCLNCHKGKGLDGSAPTNVSVHTESAKLAPIRLSSQTGDPVKWRRVHDLPDYAYFNHSVHVNKGVSCVSCHGRIDTMDVVGQQKTLSMGFCITCHRGPEPHIRPPAEVTNLAWEPSEGETAEDVGKRMAAILNVHPKQNCSTCHR